MAYSNFRRVVVCSRRKSAQKTLQKRDLSKFSLRQSNHPGPSSKRRRGPELKSDPEQPCGPDCYTALMVTDSASAAAGLIRNMRNKKSSSVDNESETSSNHGPSAPKKPKTSASAPTLDYNSGNEAR